MGAREMELCFPDGQDERGPERKVLSPRPSKRVAGSNTETGKGAHRETEDLDTYERQHGGRAQTPGAKNRSGDGQGGTTADNVEETRLGPGHDDDGVGIYSAGKDHMGANYG